MNWESLGNIWLSSCEKKWGWLLVFQYEWGLPAPEKMKHSFPRWLREGERDGGPQTHVEGRKRPYIRAERLKPRTWAAACTEAAQRCVQRVPRGLRIGQKSEGVRQKKRGKSKQMFITAHCLSSSPSFRTRVSRPPRCSSLQPCRKHPHSCLLRCSPTQGLPTKRPNLQHMRPPTPSHTHTRYDPFPSSTPLLLKVTFFHLLLLQWHAKFFCFFCCCLQHSICVLVGLSLLCVCVCFKGLI